MPTWLNAASGDWGTAGNWSEGVPNGSGANARFNNIGNGTTNHLINLGGVTRTVGSLELGSDPFLGYLLNSGTLNMQVASGNAFIATLVTQNALANASVGLQSSATLQLTSNTQFIANNNSTISIGGAITGAGRLEVASSVNGFVELLGANSARTGSTLMTSGNLSLGANNALGANTSLEMNGGNVFLNNTTQQVVLLTGAGGTISGNAGAILEINQPFPIAGIVYNGTISGAMGLTKNGFGALILTAQTSFTGATTINGGSISLGHANALAASSAVTVNAGGILDVGVANANIMGLVGTGTVYTTRTSATTLTITGNGGNFSGAITNGSGGPLGLIVSSGTTFLSGNSNTYTGGTTINGGEVVMGIGGAAGSVGTGTVTINSGNFTLSRSDNFTFANALAGAGTFVKSGSNTVTLSGNNSGFTGTIDVGGGTLRASDGNSFGTSAALTISLGGTLDLNGSFLRSYTFRSLSGNGTIQNFTANSVTLTINQAVNTTFSGVITDNGTGQVFLTKLGAGTLTLSGINTSTGIVSIGNSVTAGGKLAISGTGSIALADSVEIYTSSALDISGISGASTSIRNLVGNGGSVELGGKTLVVTAQATSFQNLTFVGSSGTDQVQITLAGSLNTFDLSLYTLSNWTNGTDRLTLTGNANANTLIGTTFADTINGGNGDDLINGGDGNDLLNGDANNDTLNAGEGNDVLNGGANDDVLNGQGGNDAMDGGEGNDTVYYDVADSFATVFGGNGTDRLIAFTPSAPTHLNLVAQGFESAVHERADGVGGLFSWNTLTETYNATWQLLSTSQVNDDATRSVVSYDRAALTWANVTDTYNAAGGRTRQNIVNDDNSYRYFFWDLANAQTWTTFDEEYTAAGVRSVQRIQNDDGTARTFYWDATNVQTWSTFDEEYAVGGARTIQRVIYDDGTSVTQTFDHNSTQTWSSIVDYNNAASQRIEQRVINDNNSYVRVFYDPTNVQPWSTQTDTYNTAGVLVSSVQVPD